MKKAFYTVVAISAALLFGASPVIAQQQQERQGQQQAQQGQQQQPGDLKGQTVITQNGERLGTIENIAQDNAGNQRYVIISRGDQQRITIPWQKIDQKDGEITANVDFSEIEQFTPQQEEQPSQALNRILGQTVQGRQGEELGTINNIVLGEEGGTMVILEGRNQEKYPIPLQALQQQQGQGFRMDQDRQNMQTAPSYSEGIADLKRWQDVIHGYYGTEPQQQAAQQQQATGQRQTVSRQEQQQAQQGDADILVTEPAPRVTVRQTQPEVRVQQPRPEISVRQQPPRVQVTQPPPRVKVTIPPPIVDITQPEPRVEISQAEPQVQVEQVPPEVQVSMAEPQVQVQQPKPEVQVQRAQPSVQVEESQPQVAVQEQGQPRVMLQRQGEAQVSVQRQGQPEVSIQRQGEPDVRYRRQGEAQVNVSQEGRQQDMTAAQIAPDQARNWIDQSVTDRQGRELGTVEDIVTDQNQIAYILIMGTDEKIHPVPAEMVQTDPQGQELRAGIDRQQFDQSPGFSPEQQQQMAQGEWEQEVRGYYQEQGGRQQRQ